MMWIKLVCYYFQYLYYFFVEVFTGRIILISDPRWVDDLHVDIEDLEF